MDFLETDFHKHRLPRRSIKSRDKDNLLIGINLQKYPSFSKIVPKLLKKSFDKEVLSTIEKGVYKTNLPGNLLDLIKLQINKISNTEISTTIDKIANEIEKA